MRTLVFLVIMVTIIGCRSEPVGKTIEQMSAGEVEAASAALMAACRAKGVDSGSRAFDDCVKEEAIRRGYTR